MIKEQIAVKHINQVPKYQVVSMEMLDAHVLDTLWNYLSFFLN